MPHLNRYSFIGNLTKAPELRFQPTAEKQALCLLNVAINRNGRDANGEKKVHTTYINDIEVWGHNGEACACTLTAGSMVLVEGRMEVDQWQDKQSGVKRSRMKVVAENVQFLKIKRPDEAVIRESPPAMAAEAPPESIGRKSRRRPVRQDRTKAKNIVEAPKTVGALETQ
jgi:single-strand DNA-binding protein